MRAEKQFLTNEYIERLKGSPFFIAAEYKGMTVADFEELRGKLREQGAEVHVVKNSVFKAAAAEAGVADLNGFLDEQIAVVFGEADFSATAKIVKEADKPKIRFGYMDEELLNGEAVERIADLPPLDVLRAQILGTIQAPATQLARVIQTPASMLARAIQARVDKES